MHKFFVDIENFHGDEVFIQEDDVKHIYKVLRLKSGDKLNINDCRGKEYLGEIIYITKNEVKVKLLQQIPVNNESFLNISLFQGLPKSSKMDLIVQKSTELGVNEITPIITERVVAKNEIGEFKKTDRWKRIALEACKQSKRSIIPEINTPIEFEEMLNDLKAVDLIIVPYEGEENKGIKDIMKELDLSSVKNVAVIIGPEGGFEEKEVYQLSDLGAHIITLGPRILRTETAGFVTVSILMYELGDLGGNNK